MCESRYASGLRGLPLLLPQVTKHGRESDRRHAVRIGPVRLLLLAAYRNRLFRCPPPVRVVPGEILDALVTLDRLVAGLAKAGRT